MIKSVWQELDEKKIAGQLKLFKSVKDAKVEIEKTEKTTDESNTKVSVVISKNGEITPEEVKKIILVVSNSVQGLKPENVIVTYENKNRLNIEADGEFE